MKLAYIDSCVWIAWIEGLPEYKKIIGQAMQTLAEAGWVYCLSEAIMLEVLANPLRLQNTALVDIYQRLFAQCQHLTTPTTVFRDALAIATAENLKGMDAVHVAIAERQGCQCLVSTDSHFARLKVLTLHWIQLSAPSP